LEQYSFRDIHNGKVFTIYINFHGGHVTARLVVDGFPQIKCAEQSWPDKDTAVAAVWEDARSKIEGLPA
jgi:hypothetical protein